MNPVKYAIVRNVKDPNRGTNEAAGIDFYIPFYDDVFMSDLVKKNPNANVRYEVKDDDLYITIKPGAKILIPSGVRVVIDPGTMLMAANKSGVSTKKGLVYTAEIVDSDYDGEIHLGVANFTSEDVVIKTGDKLIQFIHTYSFNSMPEKITPEEVTELHANSARGDKGFGEGTGNK